MTPSAIAIGEAMIEMATVGEGLFRRGFAGDTFNTAWHMQQLLGSHANIGFLTRVGTDAMSDAFVAELQADGLDTSPIARDVARTMGLYMIELDGVERRFHYWRGQSAARGLADDPAGLAQSLRGAGIIHLSGITLAILPPAARQTLFQSLDQARKAGSLISFDPNVRPRLWNSKDETRDAITTMLRLTDIALPSFDDERDLWGDGTPQHSLHRFAEAGVAEVIVKDGAGPVSYRAGKQQGQTETPSVTGVRDTTGAGDAFNAGYLAARLLRKPLPQAIAAAQRMAAEVLQNYGARAPKQRVVELAGHILV